VGLGGLAPTDLRRDNESRRKEGCALPFSTLQQRLGRKKVSEKMMRDIRSPILAFDVLCSGGELLLDRSLRERAQILDKLLAAPRKRRNFSVSRNNHA